MGLFDLKQSAQNSASNSANPITTPSPIIQADENYQRAGDDVKAAIFTLGQRYYELNKDNPASDYSDLINKVKECINKEKMWHQYRLSLEGKLLCESCGAIITSDSAFCNKCGVSVKPLDFSSIGILEVQGNSAEQMNACPSCGSPLVDGAKFCEKCGYRL